MFKDRKGHVLVVHAERGELSLPQVVWIELQPDNAVLFDLAVEVIDGPGGIEWVNCTVEHHATRCESGNDLANRYGRAAIFEEAVEWRGMVDSHIGLALLEQAGCKEFRVTPAHELLFREQVACIRRRQRFVKLRVGNSGELLCRRSCLEVRWVQVVAMGNGVDYESVFDHWIPILQ